MLTKTRPMHGQKKYFNMFNQSAKMTAANSTYVRVKMRIDCFWRSFFNWEREESI